MLAFGCVDLDDGIALGAIAHALLNRELLVFGFRVHGDRSGFRLQNPSSHEFIGPPRDALLVRQLKHEPPGTILAKDRGANLGVAIYPDCARLESGAFFRCIHVSFVRWV